MNSDDDARQPLGSTSSSAKKPSVAEILAAARAGRRSAWSDDSDTEGRADNSDDDDDDGPAVPILFNARAPREGGPDLGTPGGARSMSAPGTPGAALAGTPTVGTPLSAAPRPPRTRYFIEFEETCFNCGCTGHRQVDCEEARKERPCYLCGQWGHRPIDCLEDFCFRCGEVGHRVRECEIGGKRYVPPVCKLCKGRGHFTNHCVALWRTYKSITPASTTAAAAAAKPIVQKWCYNCSASGHFGDDCTKQRPTELPFAPVSAFRERSRKTIFRDDDDDNHHQGEPSTAESPKKKKAKVAQDDDDGDDDDSKSASFRKLKKGGKFRPQNQHEKEIEPLGMKQVRIDSKKLPKGKALAALKTLDPQKYAAIKLEKKELKLRRLAIETGVHLGKPPSTKIAGAKKAHRTGDDLDKQQQQQKKKKKKKKRTLADLKSDKSLAE